MEEEKKVEKEELSDEELKNVNGGGFFSRIFQGIKDIFNKDKGKDGEGDD